MMNYKHKSNIKWDLSYHCTVEEHRIPPAILWAPVSGQAVGCRACPSQAPHRCLHSLIWSGWTLCCPHHQLFIRIENYTKQTGVQNESQRGSTWNYSKSIYNFELHFSGTNLNQLTHYHIFAYSIHIGLVPGGQSVDCNKIRFKLAVGVRQDSL